MTTPQFKQIMESTEAGKYASNNDDPKENDTTNKKKTNNIKTYIKRHPHGLEIIEYEENLSDEEEDPETTALKRHFLHIKSERRRRKRISDGFETLKEKVPSIKSGYDSKASILFKCAEYIDLLKSDIDSLKIQLSACKQLLTQMAAPAGSNGLLVDKDSDGNESTTVGNGYASDSLTSIDRKKVLKTIKNNGKDSTSTEDNPPSTLGSRNSAIVLPSLSPDISFPLPFPMPAPGFDNGNVMGLAGPPLPMFFPMNMPPPSVFMHSNPIIGTASEKMTDFMQPTVPYYFSEEFRQKMQVNRAHSGQDTEEELGSNKRRKLDAESTSLDGEWSVAGSTNENANSTVDSSHQKRKR